MPIPSVKIYIRKHPTRRYERVKTRNPQQCSEGDVYCLHIWHNGKRRWVTAGTVLNEALRQQMVWQNALIAEKPVPADNSRKTLTDWQREFVAFKSTATKKDGTPLDAETVKAYTNQTTEFLTSGKAQYADEVTGQDLRNYMAALRKRGLTHRSICNNYTSVATFLKFCGIDHKKLLPYGERPSPDDSVVEAYEEKQLQQFFAAVNDERHRLAFEFLLKVGTREREMTTLEWTDLSLGANPTVTIQSRKPHLKFRTKTGKGRKIPLEKNLALKLAAWRAANPRTKLVFGTAGNQEDTHFYRHALAAFKRAGMTAPRRPLHRFRDTFGTTVCREGKVDLRTLQEWLGHASLAETQKYITPCRGTAAQVGINATFAGMKLEQGTAAVQ